MLSNVIKITREEIESLLNAWGCDFIQEGEGLLGRSITNEDLKDILLYSMGYVKDAKQFIEGILD